MIEIFTEQYADGLIKLILSKGHAPKKGLLPYLFKEAAKYNAVCAAVSTIEYQFYYSMKVLTESTIKSEIKNGYFHFQLSDFNVDERDKIITLSSSFNVGIRMLVDKYSDYINISNTKI